ncbi:MAG TPA: HPF/RaiA family ribosome-associated protein [Candidatus Polarisedimenticolaceae bacterium]|nr:HPF/RaiA family ribosome-associated protein [Candidatus Polarisedimenticolaceae bacterium]
MQIQVNTDSNIEGREKLADHVRTVVETTLIRFKDQITRVEVHLSDENGAKGGGDDKRCKMEARLKGRQPVAIMDDAASLSRAIDSAAGKLARLIESTLGRLRDQHGHKASPRPPERTGSPTR